MVPKHVSAAYSGNLRQLLSCYCATTDREITIRAGGMEVIGLFFDQIERQLPDGCGLDQIQAAASKLPGAVVRIAGLLHLAQQPSAETLPSEISQGTMQRATKIGRYLVAHIQEAMDRAGLADQDTLDAEYMLSVIDRKQWTNFSKRDLFQTVKGGRFKMAKELDQGLAILCDHGQIRQLPQKSNQAGGRPKSPRYERNPKASSTRNAPPASPSSPTNPENHLVDGSSGGSEGGTSGSAELPGKAEDLLALIPECRPPPNSGAVSRNSETRSPQPGLCGGLGS